RPLARSLEAPGRVALAGELRGGLGEPRLVITAPSGAVRDLPAGSGAAFQVSLPLDEPGEHRVDISGRHDARWVTVADFPLYVAEAPPSSIDLRVTESPAAPAPTSTEAVEAALLELANAARAAEGLRPLLAHAPIAEVSRAHSADMAEA